MEIIIDRKSGVADVNGKELFTVYILKPDGIKRNKRYFQSIEAAEYVARLEAKRNSCLIKRYIWNTQKQ